MATRLRGGDTSYEGRLTVATRELQEAEDAEKQAQKELEYVSYVYNMVQCIDSLVPRPTCAFHFSAASLGTRLVHRYNNLTGIEMWK